eukprot:1951474-Rhodomonas_salina.1
MEVMGVEHGPSGPMPSLAPPRGGTTAFPENTPHDREDGESSGSTTSTRPDESLNRQDGMMNGDSNNRVKPNEEAIPMKIAVSAMRRGDYDMLNMVTAAAANLTPPVPEGARTPGASTPQNRPATARPYVKWNGSTPQGEAALRPGTAPVSHTRPPNGKNRPMSVSAMGRNGSAPRANRLPNGNGNKFHTSEGEDDLLDEMKGWRARGRPGEITGFDESLDASTVSGVNSGANSGAPSPEVKRMR